MTPKVMISFLTNSQDIMRIDLKHKYIWIKRFSSNLNDSNVTARFISNFSFERIFDLVILKISLLPTSTHLHCDIIMIFRVSESTGPPYQMDRRK